MFLHISPQFSADCFAKYTTWPTLLTFQTHFPPLLSVNAKQNKNLPVLHYVPSVLVRSVCAQACLTLCGPIDCSLPGSSIHGIFQPRILEWVAIFCFKVSSQTQGWNPRLFSLLHCWQAGSLSLAPLERWMVTLIHTSFILQGDPTQYHFVGDVFCICFPPSTNTHTEVMASFLDLRKLWALNMTLHILYELDLFPSDRL